MSREKPIDNKIFNIVTDRLKRQLAIKSDSELARRLGMSQSNFAERKKRNSLPYEELIAFCDKANISIEWLFFGGSPKNRVEELQETFGLTTRARSLLKKVITAVEKYLNNENLELDPDKKAELIAILYEDLLKDESKVAEMDETIARLARLAA